MSAGFRCPNPVCKYSFPAEAVRGTAKLVCPRCAQVFEFQTQPGSNTARGPQPAVVGAEQGANALRSPAPALPPAPAASSLPAPVAAFLKRWPVWQLLVLALLFTGGCGFYTAAGLLFITGPKKSPPRPPVQKPYEFVFEPDDWSFKFTCKMKDWQQADETERELNPVLVLKRAKPNSTLVICVHDFRGRRPDDDKLKEETRNRLKRGFKELKTSADFKSKLAGKDAKRIEFLGVDSSGTFVKGDCYSLLHEAVVYLFITWQAAETKAALADEWEELRDGFVLLDRGSGSETTLRKTLFQGKRADKVPYVLYGLSKIWKVDVSEKDPDVDLAIYGVDLELAKQGKDFSKARLRILDKPMGDKTIDEQTKALEERIKKRWKEPPDEVDISSIGSVKKTEIGRDKEPAQIVRLRAKVAERNYDAYFFIVFVTKADHTLVIECECDYEQGVRSVWEGDFEQLVDSLYYKKD